MSAAPAVEAGDGRHEALHRAFLRGDYDQALALAQALWDEARSAARHAEAGTYGLLRAKVLANAVRPDVAVDAARELAELAVAVADATLEAQAWGLVASESARAGRVRDAVQAVARVLALYDRLESPVARRSVLTSLALTYQALDMPESALDAARRAVDTGPVDGDEARAGPPVRLVMNYCDIALDVLELGHGELSLDELDTRLRWLDAATQQMQAQGVRGRAGYVQFAARREWLRGDAAAARQVLAAFLRPDWDGPPALRCDLWLALARAELALGRPEAAAQAADHAERALAAVVEPAMSASLALGRRALIAECRGRGTEALALLRQQQLQQQRTWQQVLEARVDELQARLATEVLRAENAELRARADRLVDTVHQAHRQAHTDALTALLNRRGLAEALAAGAAGQGGVVAVLDLDHFKQVNDRHTHLVGDAVLRECAVLMAEAALPTDLLVRLGGEEFLLWMAGTDTAEAALRLQALCERVRRHDWGRLSPGLTLSLSGGSALLGAGGVFEEALARADAALYRAKAAGRNRIEADGPGDQET